MNVLERYTVLLNSRGGVEEAYYKRGSMRTLPVRRGRAVFHSGGQRGHCGRGNNLRRNTKAKI